MFATGEHPGDRPHGNSKDATATYVRSRGAVLQPIREAVHDKEPQAAYRGLKRDLPADDQPNNVQQVKNQKYIENRHRRGNTAPNRGNAADHIQVIKHFEEEPDSHPFARCVIRGHQQIPAIIMYIDEQLQDIRRFCCSAPIGETTVLGVDKTFNLGQFHVTVTCSDFLRTHVHTRIIQDV